MLSRLQPGIAKEQQTCFAVRAVQVTKGYMCVPSLPVTPLEKFDGLWWCPLTVSANVQAQTCAVC